MYTCIIYIYIYVYIYINIYICIYVCLTSAARSSLSVHQLTPSPTLPRHWSYIPTYVDAIK